MEYALNVTGLNKRLKGKKILSDVNITIKSGEALGLIGPNGAGKTSLIKCIAGLWRADSGSISLFGKDVKTEYGEAVGQAGFLIEYPKLWGNLNAVQNIEYLSAYYNVPLTRQDIFRMIASVGLESRMRSKLKTFSSGMYQRICLAALLVRLPKILILDEPTATLDPKSIIDFRNVLINIRQQYGVSMLVSSHNLNEVEKLCDRVVILDRGVVINDREIKSDDRKRYKIVFEDNAAAVLAAQVLPEGETFGVSGNVIDLHCTIEFFKKFIAGCPSDIKDIRAGDLESEFLSAIGGEQR